MKKSNLLILLVLGVIAIAWTAKKTKAGPLILELDKGEYLPDSPPNDETKTLFDI